MSQIIFVGQQNFYAYPENGVTRRKNCRPVFFHEHGCKIPKLKISKLPQVLYEANSVTQSRQVLGGE